MLDLYDSVFPLFYAKNDRVRPELVGTGVVVEHKDLHILLTAAHVLDFWRQGYLLTICNGNISSIIGELVNRPATTQERRKDMIDVGFVILEPDFVKTLDRSLVIVPSSRQSPPASSIFPRTFSISGFPVSREKRNVDNSISTPQWSVRGLALSTDHYESLGCTAERNVCAIFRRDSAIDISEFEKMEVPPLKGLSGGGIYEWPENTELLKDWSLPNLVGIFHTYKESEGIVIGTRIDWLLSTISKWIDEKMK